MEETQLDQSHKGTFRFTLPDGTTREIPLLQAELIIGRAAENDLVIDHPSISRRHARLRIQNDQISIEDLN